MSRSATPATRNEATTRLKPPKRTTSAKLPIGTAIRGSRGRLRTVANGCGRLRTVANGCDHKRNVERTHPQPPDPQSETGTLATHSGKIRLATTSFRDKTLFKPTASASTGSGGPCNEHRQKAKSCVLNYEILMFHCFTLTICRSNTF